MAIRKINVAAPVKPAAVKKSPAKITVAHKAGEKNAFKVTTPTPAPEVPAPVTVQAPAPKVTRPKTERAVHEATSLYTGPSAGLNKRKSRTVLDLASAGTKPDFILRDRSELVAETIKRLYGNKPFPRANFDAGILKFLLWKGHVEAVSGNGDENTILRFTKTGMAHRRQV